MTDKIDLKRAIPGYRAPRCRFEIVEIPDRGFLAVDGHGDPNTSPAYADALAALYPVAYRLKFASNRELDRDYVVPPLEGPWWAEDMDAFTVARDKSAWHWTMMILVPEWVGADMVNDALAQVGVKEPPARLGDVGLRVHREGLCAQTLHIGSFDDEAPVLARMHEEFIPSQGLHLTGTHHEIYLSDARRTAPEKQRTVLRQPVCPA